MADNQLESTIENLLIKLNSNSSIENALIGLISETREEEQARQKRDRDAVVQLFTSFTDANIAAACKLFSEHLYKEENSLRSEVLLGYLEHLVKNNIVSSKPVCEALLSSSSLVYNNRDIWCSVFSLVRRIIGGVDYKGCRDIFRAILYKCRTIPASDSTTPQIQCVVEIFNYILNRNACLLPSYFAINEIIKLPQHDDKQPLHWAFGKILAEFTQTFRPTVQIVTISGLAQLRPVIGHSNINAYVWRLELRNLRFPNNGPLPYDRDKSPTSLIRYVLTHAYSVDFMTSILIANRKSSEEGKHRYAELEEQLCEHVVHLTENQSKLTSCDLVLPNLRWHNITAHIIFFVLWSMVSFPHILMQLFKKVESKKFSGCCRDHLMWMLMQCMFGISKNMSAYEYVTFMKLYDHLYPDTESLPVPDLSRPHSVISMSVACLWANMHRKSATFADPKVFKARAIPNILRPQLEFLKGSLATYTQSGAPPLPLTCDFKLAALCNAYSSSEQVSSGLIDYMINSLMNENVQTQLPHGVACYMNTEPLTVDMLDSLSVHTKMLFIKQLFSKIESQVKNQGQVALSPALVETCARLLVYTEIEQTVGIKMFVTSVLPTVISAESLAVINTLLEMATYRLTHMQPHYRMKILNSLLDQLGNAYHNQLYTRYENTAACLLLSLGNVEVQQQVFRSITEKKFSIVSHDSEELNRILVLTLARAVNAISDSGQQAGNWSVNLLKKIHEHTPHNWSAHTLETFPTQLSDYFTQNHVPSEDKQQLQWNVDSEYQRYTTTSDVDCVAHFSKSTEKPLFFCVLWKCIMTSVPIKQSAYKILEALGPKALSVHLRTFCDYIATQLQSCQNKQTFLHSTDALRSMLWKYNLFTLDRFLLFLSLRTFEAKDAQVCLFAIQKLLTTGKFLEMVKEFSSTTPAQHWRSSKSYELHLAYHKKFPEAFFYEGILESNNVPTNMGATNANFQYLPSYFDNVCLRLLPVLDVFVHRLIEALKLGSTSEKPLISLLTDLSVLYKYHDQPVTYLYNTLHYYNKFLKDRTDIKKKLVHGILGHGERLPMDLVISLEMKNYILSVGQEWTPSIDYFYHRVKRLVNVMNDESVDELTDIDWRFAEFTSAPAHVLYSTCTELLALPVPGEQLGEELINVIFKWKHLIPKKHMTTWMNAIALILTALPEPYWKNIFHQIVNEFKNSSFLSGLDMSTTNPFEVFDFNKSQLSTKEYRCTYILALSHVIWHHSNIGQLSAIPKLIKEQLKPLVKTEQQFLYVCHLIGPFLQRFHQERAYCCIDLTIELYEILERVDKAGAELRYMDSICDFFYHIKYMYVGDEPKLEVEKVIKNLRTSLQLRLRFIAHHTTIDGSATMPTPIN